MKYENAAKIFPKPLLDEMRRYFSGGLVWVPRRDEDRVERTGLVIQLVESGVPVKEVAALAQLTQRHVHRLVRKHRQATEIKTQN